MPLPFKKAFSLALACVMLAGLALPAFAETPDDAASSAALAQTVSEEVTAFPAPTEQPTASPAQEPDAEPTPEATTAPEPSPAPTAEPTAQPTATAAPTASPAATVSPTPEPSATAGPEATAGPTPSPEPSATAEPTPSPEPSATPEPTPAAVTAIAFSGQTEYELTEKPALDALTARFPKTVTATLEDGATLELDVTWASANYENADSYYCLFYPQWDTALYPLSDALLEELPRIGVYIRPDVSAATLYSVSEENEKRTYEFLTQDMGLQCASACGIMGVIYGESRFDPTVVGDYGTSFGICQWHDGSDVQRYTNLINYCNSIGYDYRSLEGQLRFLKYETESDSYIGYLLRTYVKSVSNDRSGAYSAGYYWCYYYGVPADRDNTSKQRGSYAQEFWDKYSGDGQYTVNYDACGGTASYTSKTLDRGASLGTLPTATREGYAFAGWYTARTGGERVYASTVLSGSQTLYAQWVGHSYALRYDANGGSCSVVSGTVTFGDKYGTLPSVTRSGYTFSGWYTAKTGGTRVTASTIVSTASAHTLYAHWTARTFTVTFNANGGSCSTKTKTVSFDGTYGTLPRPTRTGYRFAGWYTSVSGSVRVLASTVKKSLKNETLYAHWTAIRSVVTFDAGDGSCSTARIAVTYAELYGTLPTPTRTGYRFAGWYTAETGGKRVTASTKVTITAAQTLYARWAGIRYVAKLDPNGGSCDTSSVIVTYGSYYGTLPTPTRTGYTFTGWFTKAVGGSKVPANIRVSTVGVHTLYAHWKARTFTIVFDANGGVCATATKTGTYGARYGTLPTPTREGYAFDGWYTSAAGGRNIAESAVTYRTANQRLYAHWVRGS